MMHKIDARMVVPETAASEQPTLPSPPPGWGAAPPPSEADVRLAAESGFGCLSAHVVGAAVRLGVLDAIAETGTTSDEVADACGAQPRAMRRLMRALVGLGFLEAKGDAYHLTTAARLVRRSNPMSLAPIISFMTEPFTVRAWEGLTEAVRTEEPVFASYFGKPFFEYLEDDDAFAKRFNEGMTLMGGFQPLEHMYNFSRFKNIVDVGGGEGALLSRIMAKNPMIHGTVLDTEAAIIKAREVMASANVADRFTGKVGDFFQAVPKGGDLYMMKGILHDWSDDKATEILRTVRAAMTPDSQLLLIEGVIDDAGLEAERTQYLMDLNMLVNFGGTERTADEHRALLAAAGFQPPSFNYAPPPLGIAFIEARPANR